MKKIALCLMVFALCASNLYSQTKVSFAQQNAGKKYKSFSFGMGVSYSNNSSLVDFVRLDFPNFNPGSTSTSIKPFDVGVDFFASAEFQLSNNWSLKGEYSYFTKTISLPAETYYHYSYNSHLPLLNLSYIKRSDFAFFKFGIGAGYDHSAFTRSVSNADAKYTASGFIIKPEISANVQLSKSVAGYISGFLDFRFTGDMKDANGNDPALQNGITQAVNLNSQGAGIRLGLSIYIF